MPDLVKARWVAGFPADLPNGVTVHTGDVAEIPAGEAHESAHWEPIPAPAAPVKGDKE